MSNKYKTIGVLGNTVRLRTDRTWIITFSNGEEAKFKSQRLAIMGAMAADLLSEGKINRVIGYHHGEFTDFDIDEALSMEKQISEYQYEIARALSI